MGNRPLRMKIWRDCSTRVSRLNLTQNRLPCFPSVAASIELEACTPPAPKTPQRDDWHLVTTPCLVSFLPWSAQRADEVVDGPFYGQKRLVCLPITATLDGATATGDVDIPQGESAVAVHLCICAPVRRMTRQASHGSVAPPVFQLAPISSKEAIKRPWHFGGSPERSCLARGDCCPPGKICNPAGPSRRDEAGVLQHFIVPKEGGSLRPILDLRVLNGASPAQDADTQVHDHDQLPCYRKWASGSSTISTIGSFWPSPENSWAITGTWCFGTSASWGFRSTGKRASSHLCRESLFSVWS